jgi:hypothetical protein
MTGKHLTLCEYAEAIRWAASTAPGIHPAAQATVATWLDALDIAARDGNASGVAALARMVEDKIKQEIAFAIEDAAGRA